jgi:hypothetical protein
MAIGHKIVNPLRRYLKTCFNSSPNSLPNNSQINVIFNVMKA